MKKFQVFNRLWVRLTLAFAVVAVIGIGLASLLANLAIDQRIPQFRRAQRSHSPK